MGQSCADLLPEIKPPSKSDDDDDGNKKKSKFQEEIEKLKMLQGMHHAKEEEDDDVAQNNEESKEEEMGQGGTTDENSQLLPIVSEDGAEVDSNTSAFESKETKSNAKPAPLPDSSESSDAHPTSEQSTSDNAAESGPTTNVPTDVAAETSAGNQSNAAVAPPTIDNQRNIPAASPQDSVLVTEPFLNGMVAAFAVTVMYLLRQAHSLLEELNDLRSQG